MQMVLLNMEELIPENHMLRKVDKLIFFDFIYDLAKTHLGILDSKLRATPGYRESKPVVQEKLQLKSRTDTD